MTAGQASDLLVAMMRLKAELKTQHASIDSRIQEIDDDMPVVKAALADKLNIDLESGKEEDNQAEQEAKSSTDKVELVAADTARRMQPVAADASTSSSATRAQSPMSRRMSKCQREKEQQKERVQDRALDKKTRYPSSPWV